MMLRDMLGDAHFPGFYLPCTLQPKKVHMSIAWHVSKVGLLKLRKNQGFGTEPLSPRHEAWSVLLGAQSFSWFEPEAKLSPSHGLLGSYEVYLLMLTPG